jgi:hypothetical protein
MPCFAMTGRKRAVFVRSGAGMGGAVWATATEAAAISPAAAININPHDRRITVTSRVERAVTPARFIEGDLHRFDNLSKASRCDSANHNILAGR